MARSNAYKLVAYECDKNTGEMFGEVTIDLSGDVSGILGQLQKVFGYPERLKTAQPGRGGDPARKKEGRFANRGRRWTEDDEENLIEMFGRGEKPSEIAKALGRTRHAITMRLEKLGFIADEGSYAAKGLPLIDERILPSIPATEVLIE